MAQLLRFRIGLLIVAVSIAALLIGALFSGRDNRSAPEPAGTSVDSHPNTTTEGLAVPGADVPGTESVPRHEDPLEAAAPNGEARLASVDPAGMYLEYSASALEGDMDAVAIQASVVRFCRDTAIPGFVEGIRESSLSEEERRQSFLRLERCQPLIDMLGDVEAEYARLRAGLREAEHPIFLVAQMGVDPEVKKARLVTVLTQHYSEPHIYERAFLEAANYHRYNVDFPDELRSEAWMILSCEASWRCDSEDYRENIRENLYQDHVYEQILSIEAEIRRAIEARDADGLGF